MPIDLPGFYFDPQKNRYFPIASKPEQVPQVEQEKKVIHHSIQKLLSGREISGKNKTCFASSVVEAQCSHPTRITLRCNAECDTAIETSRVEDRSLYLLGGRTGQISVAELASSRTRQSNSPGLDILTSQWLGSRITSLKRSPSTANLAAVATLGQSTGGNLTIFEVPCLEKQFSIPLGTSVWSADYFPCGGKVAVGTSSRGLGVVDLSCGKMTIGRSGGDVLSVKTDQTGNFVLCGYRNGHIKLWDGRAPSRTPYEMIRMPSAVSSLLLLSNGMHVVSSSMKGSVWLWDIRSCGEGRTPLCSYPGHVNTSSVLQLGIDPSESLLASGGEDFAARFWSLRSGKLLHTETGLPSLPTVVHWPRRSFCDKDPWEVYLGGDAGLYCMKGSMRCLVT